MTKSQNTKNEQQKDLCITVEKQVWESTLHRSMVLQAENTKLKELLKECLAHLTIGKYGTSVTPINILCDEVEEELK